MSPRTGRPKVDNPKDIDVKVRFDKELHDKLLGYCHTHNITRTEAIRQGVHLLLAKKNKALLAVQSAQRLILATTPRISPKEC